MREYRSQHRATVSHSRFSQFAGTGRNQCPVLLTALLWAAGFFPSALSQTFTDDSWVSMAAPAEPGTRVLATAIDADGNLIVGGLFESMDGIPANSLAKWDGGEWSTLGSGVTDFFSDAGIVNAIAVSGGNVFVGGNFLRAGGNEAWRLARWNGAQWSAVGTNRLIGTVYSLLADGDDLYVCGGFNNVAGLDGTGLLRWDGQSWNPVGELKGAVHAMVKVDEVLYAGGQSLSVNGVDLNHIAKWDGVSWSSLGEGTDDRVTALAVSGTNLYAGGQFEHAGGTTIQELCHHIARWDGSQWNRLQTQTQTGVSDFVHALVVHDGDLYVGGRFATAGGKMTACIARWDGSDWWPLGSGTDGIVNTLMMFDQSLIAGGDFDVAGGKPSGRVARALLVGAPKLTIAPAGAGQATISWLPNTPGFVLQETLSLSPAEWLDSASGSTNPITVPVPEDAKFYRLIQP